MDDLTRFEILENMGFEEDPFKKEFLTADIKRIRKLIKPIIKTKAMVSIIGNRGHGKTTAVNDALNHANATKITIETIDKRRLQSSDIEYSLILALSDEPPKQMKEIRARQLRRIIGEASKQNIVLIIENAHRIHPQTLLCLKDLKELEWMGESNLFSTVLIGQSDPLKKAGLSEVFLRSDAIYLQGLSTEEISGYIQATVGKVFTEKAIMALADREENCNYLDLQQSIYTLMNRAIANGKDKISVNDVKSVFGIPDRENAKGNTKPKEKEENRKTSGNNNLRNILNLKETETLQATGTDGI